MTTWQEFAQYRASKQPFLKRITTLEGFYNACTDSSFLAISIKDVKKTSDSDRVLAQVGLAYLPSLEPGEHLECSSANMPSLVQFYNHKGVKALTLNVRIPKDEMRQILANGEMPVRRNVRFGQHQDGVLPEYLDASISGFLDGCLHTKDRRLVCVGFDEKAWTYMRDYFPGALYYFSAYMDLRDIARDATPYTGHIPSLKKCLELFHFNGELTRIEKVGEKADNAGEHAVGVCAFATILLSEENQETFKYRIECATMARHWEDKRVRRRFPVEARFLVSVCTAAREALPYELNSSWKIAKNFHSWYPKYAVRASRTEAYVQFHNKPDMEMFIRDVDGSVYPSGETLSVMTYEGREEELEEDSQQEDCDNQEEEEQQQSGHQQEDHQQEWGRQEETRQHVCDKQKDNPEQARFGKFQQEYWDRNKEWGFGELEQFLEWQKNWTHPSATEMTNPQEIEGQDNNVETEQGWGQPQWCLQQQLNQLASGQQKPNHGNYWFQQEDWAQPPEWDFPEKEDQQEENKQQQETEERTAWNSAREYWTSEEDSSEEESEEEESEGEEEKEEEDDDDKMPELVEANPEADWEVLSD